VKIENISAFATTNDNFLYSLVLDPTYSVAPTFNGVANSCIEHAVGAGITVTGGTVIASGYVANRSTFAKEINGLVRLGTKIDGTRTSIALCARPLSANLDILGSINIIEI
jgi:hypothetical protein